MSATGCQRGKLWLD